MNAMTDTAGRGEAGPVGDAFACVDRHLATETEARALALALDLGWIDRLAVGSVPANRLPSAAGMPDTAVALVLSLLSAAGVATPTPGGVALTAAFRETLRFRDLLEARLWFLGEVSPDVHRHFGALLTDLPAFMERATVFELFRYDRCFDVKPENLALSGRWVAYTTTLTRYEAPACWSRVDPRGATRLLDLGGNSGEFARQACVVAPRLHATVFDLPVVCALGRRHVADLPGGERLSFVSGDLRHDALPQGHDLVSFKSVLHDWPDEFALAFVDRAIGALAPGGRLVIFERATIPLDRRRLSHAMSANLVFLPFFRDARFYLDALARHGLGDIRCETVELDMPFHLITGTKPA